MNIVKYDMNKKILQKLHKLIPDDGYYNTYINELKLYKMSERTSMYNVMFENWILFTFQGKKEMKLNQVSLEYTNENYLVASSTLPIECETFASKEKPFFGMVISFDLNIIYQLLDEISIEEPKNKKQSSIGTFSDDITEEIEDILYRIIKIADKKEDSEILGKSLIKELLYRVLKGKNSHFLHKLLNKSSNEAKISRSLKLIHNDFGKSFSIEDLAKKEEMSVASFHNHFKKITAYTPYQYIKKIRLNKAENLISQKNISVNEAAVTVGYETASQFSKEFKKYFGYPPKEAKASLKEYSL
ncbi:transcriptional regulator, AraC family [Arcobacter nitrofigilis DSM 7299]|uniref:Transcriptional regulator, AraC family n=1 Tax=Arcobacter nitrofigilis (strain ATCC 33309 / DSM 7299 / CCUG 15893 / LMG 7604 / NCTC 12251 / CI) TaxID=572480 RepID=D5V3Z6_ARCNC|nr:AraC family transcriptional regulator [Arcobacter nitrofigilis]ADG92824.1 transcriptional regulator, AraC family [Arcobacter nitrofigilis DSM 7299]